jgi:hypothetical protein
MVMYHNTVELLYNTSREAVFNYRNITLSQLVPALVGIS